MSTVLPITSPLYTLHVLLVDDDPEVREAIAGLLQEDGIRVTALDSAGAALAALCVPPPCPFDLLLTDVILGGPVNGFDVALAARAWFPALPVVLITGYSGPAGAVPPALALSAPLLLKPFRRRDLFDALAAAHRLTPLPPAGRADLVAA